MKPDVFDALSNPVRRALLARLRGGPLPVKQLSEGFSCGRPAISEHLALLRQVGLVQQEARGRQRYYHLQAAPLRDVQAWIAQYQVFWNEKLNHLGSLLSEDPDVGRLAN